MHMPSPWRTLAGRVLAAIRIDLSSLQSIRHVGGDVGGSVLWRDGRVLAGNSRRGEEVCHGFRELGMGGWRRGFRTSGANWHYKFMGGDLQRLPRLLIVQPRVVPREVLKATLMEAMRLVDSLEELRGADAPVEVPEKRRQSPFVLVQSPRNRSKRVSAGGYFGAGTIETVRVHVDLASSQDELDAVFVNATLSGVQQRNLEAAWGKPVLDRVGLIIEIFGAHAQTKEAKLQVELAALNYQKTRLVRVQKGGTRLGFGAGGEAEVVSARGRASGTIGGAGETELQLQRRRIGERRTRLKKLLAEVRRTRTLHRSSRQRHSPGGSSDMGLPLVAVVGYTNAGKSSMVAKLSQSNVYIDDRLFATLDSRVRSVILPSGKKMLLSDTVGFISDLPHQLVEAFQATLQEVVDADLLLHVIDSSAANADEQREAVLKVLRDIGVSQAKLDTCMVEAWNKVDLLEDDSETYSHFNVPLLEDTPMKFPDDDEDQSVTAEEKSESRELDVDVSKTEVMSGDKQEPMVVSGFGMSEGNIAKLSTSTVTGIGLAALLETIDNRLAQVVDKQSKELKKYVDVSNST
ncbi:hypothetical protein KC19_7G139200 [Ceratodon purpureus]|uniref:Hflx-type G domain-containing protein n=1 Tax=Ceratodon purpureus TaxID=3225 RepID=A0A8T0H7W9_CERPU|nr:hypothetical protein KC19_7G139200 [Ceratodon purpureus]